MPWPLTGEEYRPLLPSQESSLRILTTALSPLDYRKWRRKPWYWRLFKAFKVSRGKGAPQGHPHPLCAPEGMVGWGSGAGGRSWGTWQGVPNSVPCARCLWSWCCCSQFLLWILTRMT